MSMVQIPIKSLQDVIHTCTDSMTASALRVLLYKHSGIDQKLKTFCAIQILKYDLNNTCTDMEYDLTFDSTVLEHEIMALLKECGITLEQIEQTLIKLDWTDCIGTDAGTGKRERSMVMDYVKELYYE